LHYNLGNHQKAFKCYNKIFELKPTKSIYLEEITHLQIDSPFSIPSNMKVNKLNLEGCSELRRIGDGLRCNHLNLRDSSISQLPPHIKVFFSLNLENCLNLESLPMYLKTGSLNVAGCVNLKALPEYLNVKYLNISSCTFSSWPENITLKHGTLTARNCENLTNIPVSLNTLSSIDIRDCVLIDSIPEGTSVRNWIDIGGTRIKSFPSSMNGVQIRWRGVPIDERMAFHPELITADEILTGQNIELRRVKLERMGYERFLSQTDADMLDLDEDPGGERKLLFINLRRDEPLVCLSVFCPSTGRQYVIRVPPDKKTCHQAAAWIAGFDDPSLYNPVVET
jgi:hypothetical protein